MRVVLTIGGSVLEFTPLNDDGPYPHLKRVTDIRIAARAGLSSSLGSTETPSAGVTLQNHGGFVANLIGNPLRAKADIYDGDTLAFSGIVASIAYGLDIDLRLDS